MHYLSEDSIFTHDSQFSLMVNILSLHKETLDYKAYNNS